MTARNWLMQAVDLLAALDAPDARLDAEWMLADALSVGRGALRFRLDQALSSEQTVRLNQWLSARAGGEPLQYAQRAAYFMGLRFFVDPSVLIPRQDTEVLCEQALQYVRSGTRVLDLCTGSGALAVAIKSLVPTAQVCAADLSPEAIRIARLNAARHQTEIAFAQGDLLSAVPGRLFDVIVCNPPYIRDDEMDGLQSEVRREPDLALRGGSDGLLLYRRIAGALPLHLPPGGTALFEVGMGQAGAVRELLLSRMNGAIKIIRDLAGVERVVLITRMEESSSCKETHPTTNKNAS